MAKQGINLTNIAFVQDDDGSTTKRNGKYIAHICQQLKTLRNCDKAKNFLKVTYKLITEQN